MGDTFFNIHLLPIFGGSIIRSRHSEFSSELIQMSEDNAAPEVNDSNDTPTPTEDKPFIDSGDIWQAILCAPSQRRKTYCEKNGHSYSTIITNEDKMYQFCPKCGHSIDLDLRHSTLMEDIKKTYMDIQKAMIHGDDKGKEKDEVQPSGEEACKCDGPKGPKPTSTGWW